MECRDEIQTLVTKMNFSFLTIPGVVKVEDYFQCIPSSSSCPFLLSLHLLERSMAELQKPAVIENKETNQNAETKYESVKCHESDESIQ